MPYLSQTYDLPFQSHSDTSREAAVRAAKFVGVQGEQVFRWLAERRNGTQKECSQALGIGRPSCCARFRALEAAGRIVKVRERRDGCQAYEVVR